MSQTSSASLEWDADVRVMTHPLMLANFLKLMLITGAVMAALLSGLMAVSGSADAIPDVLELTGISLGVIAVLYVLVALLFFGNRMHMHFQVDAGGAFAELDDKRASAANKVAILAGVIAGKPGVAGAGLLAASNKEQRIAWNAVAKVRYHKRWNAIALANSWRTMVTLYCTAENYDAVATAVAQALLARPASAKKAKKSPLPKLLLHTVLTITACIPLFVLPGLDQAAMLPALLTLCFALASLWLVPLLGWAVFPGIGWLTVLELMEQSRVRSSMFDGSTFSGWSVLSGDDEAVLVLAGLGAAYLVWQTLGLLRGRIRSGFFGDMEEAEGDDGQRHPQ